MASLKRAAADWADEENENMLEDWKYEMTFDKDTKDGTLQIMFENFMDSGTP